jgi:predicted lysophospholipase L1 biosynthesis ABC-type transport system permease subunit
MDTFMEETRALLAEMGLRVSFIDNNAKSFWSIMDPLKEAKLLSLSIYSLLLVLALILAAFLYLRPRRKEFAIMRALGLPRVSALVALHVPIAILGAAGVGAGGLLGWNYALEQAAKTLAGIQNEVSGAFVPPSSALLAALCLSVFILLMLFVYLSSSHISRQPVLALLHGAGGTSRKKKA